MSESRIVRVSRSTDLWHRPVAIEGSGAVEARISWQGTRGKNLTFYPGKLNVVFEDPADHLSPASPLKGVEETVWYIGGASELPKEFVYAGSLSDKRQAYQEFAPHALPEIEKLTLAAVINPELVDRPELAYLYPPLKEPAS